MWRNCRHSPGSEFRNAHLIEPSVPNILQASHTSYPFFLFFCSEKPLPLQILLTDRQGDKPVISHEHPEPPLHPPHPVKPLPPQTNSEAVPTTEPFTDSPREDIRMGGPYSRFGKPLTNCRSLPALCVDTYEQSDLEDLAPSLPTEEMNHAPQWTRTPSVPSSRPCMRTPSPVSVNSTQQQMGEDPHCIRQPQNTSPVCSVASTLAPPTNPTRNWSCLQLNMADSVDSRMNSLIGSSLHSPLNNLSPSGSRPSQTFTLPTCQDYRAAALPVERWAENVNRYYGSLNPPGNEAGASEAGEELSELDCLYQASLQAPSMDRARHGVAPQSSNNKPGTDCTSKLKLVKARRRLLLCFQLDLLVVLLKCVPVNAQVFGGCCLDLDVPKPQPLSSRDMLTEHQFHLYIR